MPSERSRTAMSARGNGPSGHLWSRTPMLCVVPDLRGTGPHQHAWSPTILLYVVMGCTGIRGHGTQWHARSRTAIGYSSRTASACVVLDQGGLHGADGIGMGRPGPDCNACCRTAMERLVQDSYGIVVLDHKECAAPCGTEKCGPKGPRCVRGSGLYYRAWCRTTLSHVPRPPGFRDRDLPVLLE